MTFHQLYISLVIGLSVLVSLLHLFSRWKKTYSILQTLKSIWIFPTAVLLLVLLPLIYIRISLHQRYIEPSIPLWNCILTDRTSLCYLDAAKQSVKETAHGQYTYHNAHAICTLTEKPNHCQSAICNSLGRAESKKALETLRAQCFARIVPPCKNGKITTQIPCGCEVRGRGYTAYTQYWYENYWNVYRKLDKPPYCCNGKTSLYFCQ